MSSRHPRYLRASCPLIGALLAAAAGACSAASSGNAPSLHSEYDETSAAQEPILDGVDATAAYPEAAFVGGGCSGTVIAPKVVLTAGHCIYGATTVKVKVPSVNPSKWFTGKPSTHFVNKGYVDAGQVDVGLVLLDETVQLASYPVVSKNAVANSTPVVNVGRRGPDEKSQQQPHLYAGKAVPVFDAATKGFPNAYYSQQIIQFGDSGGPDFVAGMSPHTIAAVNSALMGYQLLARTDLAWDWIDQQILAHGGHGPHDDGGGGAAGSGGSSGAGGSAGGGQLAGCAQEQEPNDSYKEPQSVGIATCGTIGSASDEDWYTWTAPSSGIPYAVSVKGTDAQLKMWKKVNGQYYKVENTSATLVQNVSNGAGDYYISVWSATGTPQPYRLTVIGPFEPPSAGQGGSGNGGNPGNGGNANGGNGGSNGGQSCVGDDEKEPNDGSDACQSLDGPVCASFGASGDHDWYSWSACGAGESYTISVTGGDARVRMWRKVMGVDQEVPNQSPSLIQGVTDGPGFYKVDVWSASNKSGDYRLDYQVSGGCAGGGSGGSAGSPGGGCIYPSGPYGTKQGNVVAPGLSWEGCSPGATTPTTIKATDFFDCDGTKGIHAVQIIDSASWCSACQSEASQMEQLMKSSWTPAGVKVMQLLVENASGSPATTATAKSWKDYFKLQSVYVAADPGFLLKSPSANAYPYKVIINPRTMKIERTYTGDSYDSFVLSLAKTNAK